ncbi:MAG TPA: peptidoglycan DD-metalloendopeptidase family protein [Candidatus Dormibacteraeota bacterium]|nr:peptidoglycan DD-metalloendopeptidase family protein [Candidatus Dormibacteraeota bacterium]
MLATSLGLSLVPGSAWADTASATASPLPAASPSASPSPNPGALPSSTPAPTAAGSPAPSASSPSAPKDHLQNKEAQSQLIADLTASEAHALMLEKSLNQSQFSLVALGQQIMDSEKQVDQLDTRISTVSAQHEQLSARLQRDRALLAGVVRRLYKHQDNFFVNLIRAGGFGGLLETIGYGDVLIDRERDMVRSVQADDVALGHAQATLQRSRSSKKAILDRLVASRSLLAQAISSEQDLQTQLQGTVDESLSALDAMQTDSPEMAAKRANLMRLKTNSLLNQIEQAVFSVDAFSQTTQLITQDPVLLSTGKLLTPVPHATVTQGFGPTSLSIEPGYAGFQHFHTGIDLAVPLGTPVFAAADGVVGLAGAMTDSSGALVGYGNYIVVQHDAGLKTLYGHLLAIGVKQGDTVKRGQLIGLVGSTGNSTGPHTHFEVRIDNSPIDPMQMLPADAAG